MAPFYQCEVAGRLYSEDDCTLAQGDGRAPMSAQSQPEHVTATAAFLGLVYPGRGLERTVRKEHIDNMTAADYVKVWKVQAPPRMQADTVIPHAFISQERQ